MERCPRCSKVVEVNWAYCPTCYRPRILESLQAPVVQTAWRRKILLGLIGLASLWLLVTVGVAFLREAKAVRVSRALLLEGRNEEAWQVLQPFLLSHPEHHQALFLCGKETIRLNLKDEPKACLQQLDQHSPELAKELRADYGPILTEKARSLGCNSEEFESQLGWGDALGGGFSENVINGLDAIVDACRADQNSRELPRIAEVLAKRGKAMAMMERGYIPAINKAVAGARYQEAEALARLAFRQVPEGKGLVDAALKEERQRVKTTEAILRRLRERVQGDESYRLGAYYWCFPSTGPTAVQSAKDGWGQAVQYRPRGEAFSYESRNGCHHGFEVVSSRSPEIELNCRFWYGEESCDFLGRFWSGEG